MLNHFDDRIKQIQETAAATKKAAKPKREPPPEPAIAIEAAKNSVAATLSSMATHTSKKTETLAEADIKLPWFPDSTAGVPNGILRSALFGIVRRGKRAFLQGEQMASIDGLSVLFTGPRLDQADLDVWEYCLCLAKNNKLGARIEFSANSFLKAIGRDTGKSQHDWLENALRRLMSSVVEVKDGNKAYAGQLLHDWARDDKTKHHVIEINPAIQRLYAQDGWTRVEWQQRLSLSGHPLAQWLHGFYSTHSSPFDYKIETIHKLCMSENSQIRDFKRELKTSMGLVCKVTKWKFSISENKLSIKKQKKSNELTA